MTFWTFFKIIFWSWGRATFWNFILHYIQLGANNYRRTFLLTHFNLLKTLAIHLLSKATLLKYLLNLFLLSAVVNKFGNTECSWPISLFNVYKSHQFLNLGTGNQHTCIWSSIFKVLNRVWFNILWVEGNLCYNFSDDRSGISECLVVNVFKSFSRTRCCIPFIKWILFHISLKK